MDCKRLRGFIKPMLLILCAAALSLSAAVQTQAKSKNESAKVAVTGDGLRATRGFTGAAFKKQLLRLIVRSAKTDAKLAKTLSSKCGCSLTTPQKDDLEGFGSCMKGCLADMGIGSYALIMCSGACVFGGGPICALCLGVSVAALEACALGCGMYPGPFPCTGIVSKHRPSKPKPQWFAARVRGQSIRTRA